MQSSLLLLLATTAMLTSSTALALLPPDEPKSECSQCLVALPSCLSYIGGPPNRAVAAPSVINYPPATTLLTSSDKFTIRPPGEQSESAPSLVALSYIGGPPNRAASPSSGISCATFYQTIMSTVPACVGYLVWDPLALGFPIDTERLVEICPSSDTCQGINPSPTPRLSYIDGPPNHVASAPSDIKTTYPPATTAQLMSSDQHAIRPPCEPSECAPSLIALSYISGPPNRAALAPSGISCATFYQTIMTTGPACVCYLVQDPLTLGLPIDTGRLITMFSSSDTCRVSSVLFTALPPAEAQSTTPVCPYMRWRRHLHSEVLKYMVYGLLLATNTLNWILIICYDVPYKGQSYMYLISLIVSSIPVFLIPSKHFDNYECIKLVTGIVGTAICLLTDIAVYWNFGHQQVGIAFVIVESTGAIVVRLLGEKTTYIVQLMSSSTNLVSILVYIVCILCNARWDYVNLEVLSAFLSAGYTALDLIYVCDTPNTVILGVAVLTRTLYGILLIFRSHTRGIFSKWFFGNDVEQTGYVEGTRRLRPWRQIWRRLIQTYGSPTLGLLQIVCEFIWKILEKAG